MIGSYVKLNDRVAMIVHERFGEVIVRDVLDGTLIVTMLSKLVSTGLRSVNSLFLTYGEMNEENRGSERS